MTLSDVQNIKIYMSQYYENTAYKFINSLKDKIIQIKEIHLCTKYIKRTHF